MYLEGGIMQQSRFMMMVSRVSGEPLEGCKGIRGTAGRLQGYQGNRWKVARVSGEPLEGCKGIRGIKIFYL
jgi:hypothetical protein